MRLRRADRSRDEVGYERAIGSASAGASATLPSRNRSDRRRDKRPANPAEQSYVDERATRENAPRQREFVDCRVTPRPCDAAARIRCFHWGSQAAS
jgi:hypothetical protein